MSLQLTPSSSGLALAPGSSPAALLTQPFGGRSPAMAINGAGGYYSSIGGGAAPFGPSLNIRSLKNGGLLKSCAQQIQHENRKRRSADTISIDDRRLADAARGGALFHREGSTRMGKLYCRSGYHLQIHKDGRVNGTRQETNRFGILEFLSIAFGLVSIKGKESDLYLCMNRRGRLYGSTIHTGECVFMEKMLENYYNTYTSCRYGRGSRSRKKWYVALNKRGRPKRGNQSRKKHKYTQFLVLHLDDDDYKWTRRKLVFSTNNDRYLALNRFRNWDRISPMRQNLTPAPATTNTIDSSSSTNSSIPTGAVARRNDHL